MRNLPRIHHLISRSFSVLCALLFFTGCSETNDPEPSFLNAPEDFRLEFFGYLRSDGDSVNFTLSYDDNGDYLDWPIELDEQGRVTRSRRPGRGQMAFYFYGEDFLLDSIEAGYILDTIPGPYISTFYYTYDDNLIPAVIGERQVWRNGGIGYDYTHRFIYSDDKLEVEAETNSNGRVVDRDRQEHLDGEGFIPFPPRYRQTHFWGFWGRSWADHLGEKLVKAFYSYDAEGTILQSITHEYVFNDYGYPIRRATTNQEGDVFEMYFSYNYD